MRALPEWFMPCGMWMWDFPCATYRRWRAASSACDDTDTLQNVLFAYYHLGFVRNKISHADADAMAENRLMVSDSDDSSALAWMKDSIDFFIDSYEKAIAQVQGKKPQIILISGNDVRKAAERMRHERGRNN